MRIWAGLLSLMILVGVSLSAQDGSQPGGPVIRAEKKLVLVDVVVTDKKGGYVRGLTAKDFRLWEDKQEQNIETFSAESDPASGVSSRKHYLVLFFDNTSIGFAEQAQARQAALRFLDKNGGPNRLIADREFRRQFADCPELHLGYGAVETGSERRKDIERCL